MDTRSYRRRKRIRALDWLLKRSPGTSISNAQAFAGNLLPVPDPGELSVPHNLSKEVSRRGWKENFTTSRVFL